MPAWSVWASCPFHEYSVAAGISGDGSVVVGNSLFYVDPPSGGGTPGGDGRYVSTPFVWDEVHGMRSLYAVLHEAGVEVPADWYLTSVNGISADGRCRPRRA